MRSIVFAVLAISLAIGLANAQLFGPYVDELVFVVQPDEFKAVRDIAAGRMHLWAWYIRSPDNLAFARENGLWVINVAGCGVYNLQINPATTETGFNPFTIREVREALNYLVDRKYIAEELMRGLGIPQYTLFRVGSPEYVRYIDLMLAYESKYAYNPEKGRQMIFDALRRAGAEFRDGKWYYQGEPIRIIIFARAEDVRKDIGQYLGKILEELGFTVEVQVQPAAKAVPVVYRGDPRKGEWHIYTEGWAFTGGMTAYEDDNFEFFYASAFSGTILNPELSDYPERMPAELKELARRMTGGEYRDVLERRSLVERLLDLTLRESVRVWLVTQKCPMAAAPNVRSVYDLMGGFWTRFTFRTLRFTDRPSGGTMVIGLRTLFIEPWNPYNNWLYDQQVLTTIYDFGVWINPHTGRYTPVRARFTVETAGPEGKLDVPPDALKYDFEAKKWVPVGEGVKATSKVTWEIAKGYWHYAAIGRMIPVTWADVLYGLTHLFEIVNPDSPIHDPGAVTPTMEDFVNRFRGIRLVGETEDTITVEVYIDYWHLDDTFIAGFASITPAYPWELWYLMEKSVEMRRLAWVVETAQQRGIETLDYAKGPALEVLKEVLDEVAGSIPPQLEGIVSRADADNRWAALADWYNRMGHFLVSNGPYYLDKVDTAALQVRVKAFRNYPLPANAFDKFLKPRVPTVEIADIPPIVYRGQHATITISAMLEGEPYDDVTIKYRIVDAAGNVVASGDAARAGAGLFTIEVPADLSARLSPGTYRVIIVAVGKEAAVPITLFRSFAVSISPEEIERRIGGVEERLSESIRSLEEALGRAVGDAFSRLADAIEGLKGDIESVGQGLRDELANVRREVTTATNSVNALAGQLTTVNALVIIVVILTLINLALAFRRPRQ